MVVKFNNHHYHGTDCMVCVGHVSQINYIHLKEIHIVNAC